VNEKKYSELLFFYSQKTIIGEWYWLKYSQPPMAGSRRFPPIARELVKTDARCNTRTVLGICAQVIIQKSNQNAIIHFPFIVHRMPPKFDQYLAQFRKVL
jgi:hypothetical protein